MASNEAGEIGKGHILGYCSKECGFYSEGREDEALTCFNQRMTGFDLWLRKITLTELWDLIGAKLEMGRIDKRLLKKARQEILRVFIEIVAVGMEKMGLVDALAVNPREDGM